MIFSSVSRLIRVPLVGVLGLALAAAATARDDKPIVAKAGLLPAGLVHRPSPSAAWKLLGPGGTIVDGEVVVGVPVGTLDSKNGNVRLGLLSDLARISPYPVLETAVMIHESKDFDLDFTLDRGRVNITNRKKSTDPVKVRVRFQDHKWDMTFHEPDASVAVEMYGRWPKGIPFRKQYKPDEHPTIEVVLVVRKGQVDLKADGHTYAMKAPPGVAYFHWDSVAKHDEDPKFLESLPAWASSPQLLIPKTEDVLEIVKIIRGKGLASAKSIEETVGEALNSESGVARKIAVYLLGALDDLPRLADCLVDPKHHDIRDISVMALRHWIGRGPGQDIKLHDVLVKDKKYSEKQAELVLNLLHSFSSEQLAQPATYETLIDLLLHDKLAVRELASWHLERLVAAGKDIPYDATASKEELQKSHDKWKELIPSGKLPPENKK